MRRSRPLLYLCPLLLLLVNLTAHGQYGPGMGPGNAGAYPCVAAPLPPEPFGASESMHVNDDGHGYTLHAWRFPCDGDRSVPMITIEPDDDARPLICFDDGIMVQRRHQDGHYRWVQDPMTPGEAFCDHVIVPTSLALMGYGEHFMDQDRGFHFMLDPATGIAMDWPAYDASVYGMHSAGHAIVRHRGLSGIWYDPETAGQGLSLHLTPAGLVLFFYGYDSDGLRLWLISGVQPAPLAYAEAMTVELFRGEGGHFGMPRSDTSPWGNATITFEDCTHATAVLEGADGRVALNLVKLAGIEGVGCY